MKLIKPARLYLALLFVGLIIFMRMLVYLVFSNGKSGLTYVHLPHRSEEIDFSKNSFFPDSPGDLDPFINRNYLNKKLLQLVSLTHLSSQSNVKETSNHNENNSTDFSYLLDELMSVIKVKNFFSRLWGCREAGSTQIQEILFETEKSAVYPGVYNNKGVRVEIAKADLEVLVNANCGSSHSDTTQQNLDRCLLLKNRRILDQAVLLLQLSHANIARILGLCVQRVKSNDKPGKVSSSGVVLIRETGSPARIEKLKMLGWEERLKICFELLKLATYFSNTPLGSVRLENWNPNNFILNAEDRRIQLNDFDQLIYLTEPQCINDQQCYVDGINCGLKCVSKQCYGYNAKKNLHELNHAFLAPLLRYNVPQKLSETALNILVSLNTLKISAFDLVKELKPLMPKTQSGRRSQDEVPQKKLSNNNPALLNMERLPDGWQVDSWEQHESKVAINEVNLGIAEQPQPVIDHDSAFDFEHSKEKGQIPQGDVTNGFQKIDHADFPGRYDYHCSRSKAEWGCVMSLHTIEDAMHKCSADDKCKSFVTIPHLRKEGWIIAILKSDKSNPVDHAGTTVYVRLGVAEKPDNVPQGAALELKEQGHCLDGVIASQSAPRESCREVLMRSCGWAGMTDDDLAKLVQESKVVDASKFKPSHGKLANGGQMNIVLTSGSKSLPALFLAKRGPDEFDVSQLAVYHLDRMLGLYKTIPAFERKLSSSELSDAGFPMDVGGNQFDNFRPLKQSDGSLLGVVVPQIPRRVSIEHYISVPRLSGITNAVTPFTKRQWSDLEYLLLGFVAAIPASNKGHQSVQGQLIHLKAEEAFLRNSNDYISYLYNCQFPLHVIATLRHAITHRCDLGSAVQTRLLDSNSPQIAEVMRTNVVQLLNLVDQCITRFGKQVVLYDATVMRKR